MASEQCRDVSGWPGEEVRCIRLCEPGRTFHDGYHQFPHVSALNKEDEVESIVKMILETMKANAVQQEALIAAIEKALKTQLAPAAEPEQGPKKRTKKEEPKEEPKPAVQAEGLGSGTTGSKAEEKPLLVQDVTIEMLREMATKYSKAFGMEKLLDLNVKHGGAKKLSGIDPKMYGVIYGAMGDALAKATEAAIKEPEKKNGEVITLEAVRKQAADFMTANGQPALQALLKAFGAAKLSELAKEKYPAFIEAISNA